MRPIIEGLYVPRVPHRDEAGVMPARIKLQAVIGAEKAVFLLFLAAFLVFLLGVALGPVAMNVVNGKTSIIIAFRCSGLLAFSALTIWLLVDN